MRNRRTKRKENINESKLKKDRKEERWEEWKKERKEEGKNKKREEGRKGRTEKRMVERKNTYRERERERGGGGQTGQKWCRSITLLGDEQEELHTRHQVSFELTTCRSRVKHLNHSTDSPSSTHKPADVNPESRLPRVTLTRRREASCALTKGRERKNKEKKERKKGGKKEGRKEGKKERKEKRND